MVSDILFEFYNYLYFIKNKNTTTLTNKIKYFRNILTTERTYDVLWFQ